MALFKRALSLILVFALVITCTPFRVFATEEDTEYQSSIDTGETTIDASNSLGELISEDLQHAQTQQDTAQTGYGITEIAVDGSIATVRYETLEDALLIVGIYTEDSGQLLASGYAEVSTEDTYAYITIDGDIPQYFMASAYLVDTDTNAPLCPAFDTPMYTQDMQELLVSTVADYDEDLVLNLDDDTTTNFMVYNEATVVVEPQQGVNIVASIDHATQTYVFENADATFTSMQAGDILSYPYSEGDLLITKVSTVDISGTTVTVHGCDVELEEVFSHVKIEAVSQANGMEVDDSTASEEVTFEGFEDAGTTYGLRAIEDSGSISRNLKFVIGNGGPLSADLSIGFNIHFDYYITLKRQHISYTNDIIADATVKLTAAFDKKVQLGEVSLPLIPGILGVGIDPALQLEAEAELSFSATLTAKLGFSYRKGDGFNNLSTKPELTLHDADLEISLFFGIDMAPEIDLFANTLDVGISSQVGAFIGVSRTESGISKDGSYSHACEKCFSISVAFGVELSAKIDLICNIIKLSSPKLELKTPALDLFYISVDQNRTGFGSCPYRNYLLTVYATLNAPVSNANVTVTDVNGEQQTSQTNSDGIATFYVPVGKVYASATKNDLIGSASGAITKKSVKLSVELGYSGELANNCRWTLNKYGDLTIYGSAMADYESSSEPSYSKYKDQIKTVTLRNISHIGSNAFAGYTGISYVSMGSTVKTVGASAFSGCTGLTSVHAINSSYGGVLQVGSNAFAGCTNLTGLQFLSRTTSIGAGAFSGCSSVTNVTIPTTLTDIGNGAFIGCTGLAGVSISNLKKWCEIDFADPQANPLSYAGHLYFGSTELTSLSGLSGLTTIGDYAFYNFTGLTSLVFPEGLAQIGNAAFSGCTDLAAVTFSLGAPSIGDDAFRNVTASMYYLDYDETWTVANKLQYGGTLTWVPYEIPVDSGICGEKAFWRLDEEGTLTVYGSGAMYDYSYSDNAQPWNTYCSQIKAVVIEEGITHIGNSAFADCDNLLSVSVPGSVATIGDSVFYSCSNLSSVALQEGLISIGDSAFSNCSYLTSITIPDTVTSIGPGAFYWCWRMTSIVLSSNITSINNDTFSRCGSLSSVSIPEGVTHIGAQAFAYCDSLTSITIPNSVTSIGTFAFLDCIGVTNVTIPDSVTYIGDYVFDKTPWYANQPDGLVYAGKIAYKYKGTCPATIALNEGTLGIAGAAFANCTDLTSIIIPDSVKTIGPSAFNSCTNLASINIPEEVVVIDSYAFYGCNALTSVDIPDNVSIIGSDTFKNCTKLAEITIGCNVSTIGSSAFENCSSLTSIIIPAHVASISLTAFRNCSKLSSITFQGDAPEFGSVIFSGVTATAYYPANNSTWTEDVMQSYGGTITWVAVTAASETSLSVTGGAPLLSTAAIPAASVGIMRARGGDTVAVSTATFAGLIAGQEYLFLAVVNPDAVDLLAADNLLFIDQGTAADDGTLVFRYIPRRDSEDLAALVFGASNKDLKDAVITSPAIDYNGQTHVVDPTVAYNGEVLTEGVDYTVSGTATFMEPGIYVCYITGIGKYTGEVEFAYGDLSAALGATNSYITLPCDMQTDVTVNTGAYLDLNGHTLTGNITVSDGAELSVFDSATADYTTEDRGKIIGSVQGDLARSLNTPKSSYGHNYKYLALQESSNVWSFHRYYLTVKSIILAPYMRQNGITGTAINYRTIFRCSDMLAEYVTAYGAKLVGDNTVYADYIANGYSLLGAASANEQTTQLGGIMKSTNSTALNNANSRRAPAVSAYITLSDGTELTSVPVTRTLRDMVSYANSATNLTEMQETALGKMYDLFKPTIDLWTDLNLSTIKAYAAEYCGTDPTVTSPFAYSIENGEVTITGYNGEAIDLEIPAQLEGYPVTTIAAGALKGQTTLTSVTIPDGITSIGDSAFYGCTNITSIRIPHTVQTIGSEAFYDCTKLTGLYITDIASWCGIAFADPFANPMWFSSFCNLYVNDVLVTELVIPDGVTSINDYAFNGNSYITSVTMPDSVVTIGIMAFSSCSDLTDIAFSANITSISSGAFQGCTDLSSISIPNGVTDIGDNAFNCCTSLSSITIPDSVTNIGDQAFRMCESLTSIVIPDGVTSIGSSVFEYCYALTDVTLSRNLTAIPYQMFYNCSKLASINIPDNATSIGNKSFYGCSKLSSVTIPNSITSIGFQAFYRCTSTKAIIYTGTTEQWNSITKGTSWDYNSPYTLVCLGDISGSQGLAYTLSSDGTYYSVSGIGTCTDTDLVIPDTYEGLPVNEIANSAFRSQTALTSITIPDSVTSIGDSAFYHCSGLTSVTIPDGVTIIGNCAFLGCTGLTGITIPGSIISIGTMAFDGCSELTAVYISDLAAWCAIDFQFGGGTNPLYYAKKLYLNNTLLTSVTIPDNVTSISSNAFYGYSGLTSITIPDSVTMIGDFAFLGCSDLISITIPNSITNIGKSTFYNCTALNSVTIPDSVISIGSNAFYGCSGLTSIIIPDGVTSIGSSAFESCTNLTSIAIPSSVTSIGNWAFYKCTALETITYTGTTEEWEAITKGTNWALNCPYSLVCLGDPEVDPPVFTVQPESVIAIAGQTVTFYVQAQGTEVSYRWQFRTSESSSWNDSSSTGADTDTLTVKATAARNGYQYRCIATDSLGQETISDAASLSVIIVQINEHPADAAAAPGISCVFHVSAEGDISSYQWQYSTNGTTWNNSSSATAGYNTDTLTVESAKSRDGFMYRCVITGSDGNTYITESAVLTVLNVQITGQPQNVVQVRGKKAVFQISGAGSISSYQWQYSANGTSWYDSSSATQGYNTETLTVNATSARNGFQYRCVLQDVYGNTYISDPAVLTVIAAQITTHPQDAKAGIGGKCIFRITAEGEIVSYQWQYSANGTSWHNSSSATLGYNLNTLTVTATTARNGFLYRCVVTDADGNKHYSEAATLTALTARITEEPQDADAGIGGSCVFRIAAEGEISSYQWQYSTNGTSWNNSSSATQGYNTDTLTVTATAARNDFQYRCVVTDADGNKHYSAAATLTALTARITEQPQDAEAGIGGSCVFRIAAEGDISSYQWQYSTNGTSWNNSSSATLGYNTDTLTVTATAARNGFRYRCVVTDAEGIKHISEYAVITVLNMRISQQPSGCTAQVGEVCTFTVGIEGNAASYQWQYCTNGTTWNASGQAGCTTDTLTVEATNARNGYQYRCVVTGEDGIQHTSDTAMLIVGIAGIFHQPESAIALEGDSAVFSVDAGGSISGYRWQYQTADSSVWNNSSSTTQGYNTNSLTVDATEARNGFKYRCVVTATDGSTVISEPALLTVHTARIVGQPQAQQAVSGGYCVFSVNVTGAATGYQWQYSTNGTSWNNSSMTTQGYNTDTLVVEASSARDGFMYRCVITDSCSNEIISEPAAMDVTTVQITESPQSLSVNAAEYALFTVEVIGEVSSYRWQYSTNGTSWNNSSSATKGYNTNILTVEATTARNGFMYRCVITDEAGNQTISEPATLTVK